MIRFVPLCDDPTLGFIRREHGYAVPARFIARSRAHHPSANPSGGITNRDEIPSVHNGSIATSQVHNHG